MSVNLHRSQRGVSIVEALVAFLVLSVGMLGIAGLYLESLRANRTAQNRTLAVQLANDMSDRIRANRSAEAAYAVTLGAVPPAATRICSTDNCSSAQLAAFDLRAWYDHVLDAMPDGADGSLPQVGVVYVNGANVSVPDRYVVTVGWREPGSSDLLTTIVEVMQLGDQ
jgi:type IV pilus assembly protein PilV